MLWRSTSSGHGPFDGQMWDKTFVPHPGAARKHHLGYQLKNQKQNTFMTRWSLIIFFQIEEGVFVKLDASPPLTKEIKRDQEIMHIFQKTLPKVIKQKDLTS